MKVVITSATEKELLQVRSNIASLSVDEEKLNLSYHISGVGILSSCFSIAKLIFETKPDLIIQAGIAGCFDENVKLGTVVTVIDEIIADNGVEENGKFIDLFDLNLQQQDGFPFTGKRLQNNFLSSLNHLQLEEMIGVTVNEITTRPERIKELKLKYNPSIESMEGAALHYCCIQTATPFIQIRSISNYIGERDKLKWQINAAFDHLGEVVTRYIHHLQK